MVAAAKLVETAVNSVIEKLETVTPDLGGNAGTDEMGQAICREIESLA